GVELYSGLDMHQHRSGRSETHTESSGIQRSAQDVGQYGIESIRLDNICWGHGDVGVRPTASNRPDAQVTTLGFLDNVHEFVRAVGPHTTTHRILCPIGRPVDPRVESRIVKTTAWPVQKSIASAEGEDVNPVRVSDDSANVAGRNVASTTIRPVPQVPIPGPMSDCLVGGHGEDI